MTDKQADTDAGGAPPRHYNDWLALLILIARFYRIDGSAERVRTEAEWRHTQMKEEALVEMMARHLGLCAIFDRFDNGLLDPWRLPMIVDFGERGLGVIEAISTDGEVEVRFSGETPLATRLTRQQVCEAAKRVVRVKPEKAVPDARVDDYIKPYEENWLRRTILQEWPGYINVMAASLVANVLTLSAMLFSMQVYDRVIPAQSTPTLWVLFSGVAIAMTFVYVMRMARTWISDTLGKRADVRISDRVFGHALRLRSEARPKSTGSFIAQIRELEQIRELITSTTIGAIADLPFSLLFLALLWLMGGWLALVPLVAIPLIVLPGQLLQPTLAKLSRETMRESALRNAILVESAQALDDIKSLRAEPYFQNQWNHLTATIGDTARRQRFVSGLLINWTAEVQTLAYVTVILIGAFFAMEGEISTGVLIGCSMLASRIMAPLTQLAMVMTRWQQAKVAREGVESLLKSEVDAPENGSQIALSKIHGEFVINDMRYRYDEESSACVLDIASLTIRPGEKVAVLGRNGSGKSTLLQLLCGLLHPREGTLLLDGVKMASVDPQCIRRDVAYLSQQSALFYGTVKQNLLLGAPTASDEQILAALELSGAIHCVRSLPEGLDYLLMEGGRGLSGGQRQQLLLARTLLRDPQILILDEPTAWLDDGMEKHIVDGLKQWLGQRTLIVATHRPAVLQLTERVLFIENGKIMRDGSKEKILRPSPHPATVKSREVA